MELSSNLADILSDLCYDNGKSLIFVAGFSAPVFFILAVLIGLLLRPFKVILSNFKLFKVLSYAFVLSGILGFLVVLLLHFLEIPGIKILFILLAIHISYFLFVFFNFNRIEKWIVRFTNTK